MLNGFDSSVDGPREGFYMTSELKDIKPTRYRAQLSSKAPPSV